MSWNPPGTSHERNSLPVLAPPNTRPRPLPPHGWTPDALDAFDVADTTARVESSTSAVGSSLLSRKPGVVAALLLPGLLFVGGLFWSTSAGNPTETVSSLPVVDAPERIVARPVKPHIVQAQFVGEPAAVTINVDPAVGFVRVKRPLASVLRSPETPGFVEVIVNYNVVFVKSDPYAGQPPTELGKWLKLSAVQMATHPLASGLDVGSLLHLIRRGATMTTVAEAISQVSIPTSEVDGDVTKLTNVIGADRRAVLDASLASMGASLPSPTAQIRLERWRDANSVLLREKLFVVDGGVTTGYEMVIEAVGQFVDSTLPKRDDVVSG